MPTRGRINVPGQNRILRGLPTHEFERLIPSLERVHIELKEVVYDVNIPISHAYFPTTAVLSLLAVMGNGSSVEIGTVGNEGVAGIPVFLGAGMSPTRALCQAAGEAFRMEVGIFRTETAAAGPFREAVQHYTQAVLSQISQSVACNQLHSVEQRMCRWLLMMHDRVGSEELPLTQEFLAQMLGVRRASVTVIASALQQAGLIRYRRGRVTVLDRTGLETASCECYLVVRREFERLLLPEHR